MDLRDQSAVSLTNLIASNDVNHLGIDTRNPIFGVYDLVRRLNPTCLATKTSLNIEKKLCVMSLAIIITKKRITKALIRLRRCAVWSTPLLFACNKTRVSRDTDYTI